jgi:phosphatidylglycerol:prolipoprotein diacylglycerol transferase
MVPALACWSEELPAFPYVTDAINAAFGTHWRLPVPTFGLVVAISAVVGSAIATQCVTQSEKLGKLPIGTRAIVADTAFVCFLAGIIGARVFSIFENFSLFLADPLALILTRNGFSIYGGLAFGLVAGIIYVKRRSIPILPMLDAVSPALILAYGIGRLGCQLSGDGDWGISAKLALKPSWLPEWLWVQTYDGNIVGVPIAPPGVYPTPIYETIAALVLFVILWLFQSHRNRAGFLFAVYLLATGFERLLIEKIRINTRYDVFGVYVTQAEVISVLLVMGGLLGVLITFRKHRFWTRAIISAGVLSALAACAPH